jgi:hypothetical protein
MSEKTDTHNNGLGGADQMVQKTACDFESFKRVNVRVQENQCARDLSIYLSIYIYIYIYIYI